MQNKSVSELFEEILKGDFYDDAPWEAISFLRHSGTTETFEEVFQRALEFSNSDDPLRRARGINVLAQLGCTPENSSGIHPVKRLEIALHHLADQSEMVVEASAWALANIRGEKAIKALLTMRHSSNADVRHAIALGLLGETSAEAIETLIELTQDVDDDVRDYATWSLGSVPASGSPSDSVEIREALRNRLNDACEEIHQEAIWGLAIRKDSEGMRILLDRFENDKAVMGDQEAAEYLLGKENIPDLEILEGLRRLLDKQNCRG